MKLPVIFASPFRGWFFSGSLSAFLLVLPWVLQLYWPMSFMPLHGWFWWHQHEMVYAIAVPYIIGFLLTASQNWTGLQPVTPKQTMFMLLIFWLARLAILMSINLWMVAIISAIPILLASFFLGKILFKAKNFRNLVMVVLLILFAVSEQIQLLYPHYVSRWATFSIMLVVFLMTILGGRVIPFFTAKRLNQSKAVALVWLDRFFLIIQIAFAASMLVTGSTLVSRLLALTVFLCGFVVWVRWQSKALWQVPLLWGLHLAYLGLVLGWLVFALIPVQSYGLHTQAIAGIALMIVAFGGRVSLAHSGRALQPPRRFTLALGLLVLAVCFRVFLPLLFSDLHFHVQYLLPAVFWTLAFLAFTSAYIPVWFQRRKDGQPG